MTNRQASDRGGKGRSTLTHAREAATKVWHLGLRRLAESRFLGPGYPALHLYFVLSYAATWMIGGIALLFSRWHPAFGAFDASNPFNYLAAYSVSATGICLTAYYDGKPGLKRLVDRLSPWNAHAGWYLIVIGGYAALTAAAIRLSGHFHYPPIALPGWRELLYLPLVKLAIDPGPVGEEFGWRGFALPRMVQIRTPIVATIILGILHTFWHLPLFFIPGTFQSHLSFPVFGVGVLALAVIDTWLYLHTRANLLLAILAHFMANFCSGMLGPESVPFLTAGEALAVIAIIVGGGLNAAVPRPSNPEHRIAQSRPFSDLRSHSAGK
jgi:membrane protease YdiL (CAAX protease family)